MNFDESFPTSSSDDLNFSKTNYSTTSNTTNNNSFQPTSVPPFDDSVFIADKSKQFDSNKSTAERKPFLDYISWLPYFAEGIYLFFIIFRVVFDWFFKLWFNQKAAIFLKKFKFLKLVGLDFQFYQMFGSFF